jgi:hypothetical protein
VQTPRAKLQLPQHPGGRAYAAVILAEFNIVSRALKSILQNLTTALMQNHPLLLLQILFAALLLAAEARSQESDDFPLIFELSEMVRLSISMH